jgi:hypothetical protein
MTMISLLRHWPSAFRDCGSWAPNCSQRYCSAVATLSCKRRLHRPSRNGTSVRRWTILKMTFSSDCVAFDGPCRSSYAAKQFFSFDSHHFTTRPMLWINSAAAWPWHALKRGGEKWSATKRYFSSHEDKRQVRLDHQHCVRLVQERDREGYCKKLFVADSARFPRKNFHSLIFVCSHFFRV